MLAILKIKSEAKEIQTTLKGINNLIKLLIYFISSIMFVHFSLAMFSQGIFLSLITLPVSLSCLITSIWFIVRNNLGYNSKVK